MSKEHLDDILTAFSRLGYELLTAAQHDSSSPDPFSLQDDKIRWALVSPRGEVIELDFYAFDSLGRRTTKLTDILYCTNAATGDRLYFDKRKNKAWTSNLRVFVRGPREE